MTASQAKAKERARERKIYADLTIYYYRYKSMYGDTYKAKYAKYRQLGGRSSLENLVKLRSKKK